MPANKVVIKIRPVLHAMNAAGLFDERNIDILCRYETSLAQFFLYDWHRKEMLGRVGGGWERG